MSDTPDRWTLVLTGENHGLVGIYGGRHEHAPAHYERVNVVRESLLNARITPEACAQLLEAVERLLLVLDIADLKDAPEADFARKAVAEAKRLT